MLTHCKKLLVCTLSLLLKLFALTVIIYSVVFWIHFKAIDLLIDNIQNSIENNISARILFKEYEIDYFNKEIIFKDISFYRKDLNAHLNKLIVRLKWPDFIARVWPIKEIVLDSPNWQLLRDKDRYYIFPDFITQCKNNCFFSFPIDKIILKTFKFYYEDQTVQPFIKTELGGQYFIIVIDHQKEKMLFKGYINPFFAKDSETFIDYEVEFDNFSENFILKVSGKNLDFSKFTPYHYDITKLEVNKGRGIVNLEIENRLGVLHGYFYLKIKNPQFDGFNESIFSEMGLSKKGFINMIEENNNELILDFYIYGTSEKPGLKLGDFSRTFFLNVPITITKGSITVVEKLFNTILLGIPRKIYKAGKARKNNEDNDELFSVKNIQP